MQNHLQKLWKGKIFIISLLFILVHPENIWSENISHLEKAKQDAQRAKLDAQRAIDEAEKAILEAEATISKAKKQKAHALETMVKSGYYPEDLIMTTTGSATTAVFSHKKHTEREQLRCIDCHPKVFIMKVGKNVYKEGHLSMAQMKKGKYCGNCHNGQKAFSVTSMEHCTKCHSKQD